MRKRDYEDALMVQSACNLPGVIRTFNEILSRLAKEAQEQGRGTDWINTHPICVLFAEQVKHLANRDYLEAYKACDRQAKS